MKSRVEDLAIFGGEPAFKETLHVGRPNIGDRHRLIERINRMLDERWLTNNGPYVQEFERRVAEMLRVKHCIATCNATVAMEIAARALDLKGEVILPSMTFVATAHALQWQQITPVFCDVDPATHALDPRRVETMITPRTTAILGVHIWGRPCNIDALTEIATRRNLRVLFDAAHAFGCSHKGEMIGNFGDAEIFSFHATKVLNTFEGGAVTTNNDELAEKIQLMRNFGFAGYDDVIYIGTNGKMSEVAAAMGLTSLESLVGIVATNKRNYDHYRVSLDGIDGVNFLQYDENQRNNYQYVVITLDDELTGISRDQMIRILWAENIMARRYFYPGCHRMEPYRSYYPHAGLVLPETNVLTDCVLQLPTGTNIGVEQIELICKIFKIAMLHSVEIRCLLDGRVAVDLQASEGIPK